MSHQSIGLLMLLATLLMIAAPVAVPLTAYWNCRRLKFDATDDVIVAIVADIIVAAVCYMLAKRLAYELA